MLGLSGAENLGGAARLHGAMDTDRVPWCSRKVHDVQTCPWLNLDTQLAITPSFSGLSNWAERSSGMGIFSTSSTYGAGSWKSFFKDEVQQFNEKDYVYFVKLSNKPITRLQCCTFVLYLIFCIYIVFIIRFIYYEGHLKTTVTLYVIYVSFVLKWLSAHFFYCGIFNKSL